jgi:hypothetical protein
LTAKAWKYFSPSSFNFTSSSISESLLILEMFAFYFCRQSLSYIRNQLHPTVGNRWPECIYQEITTFHLSVVKWHWYEIFTEYFGHECYLLINQF